MIPASVGGIRVAAAYETVDAALADLGAIEQLHKDEMIGQYDAAVIDQENGKPHRRTQQRAAGSAQELTVPQQSKAVSCKAAFLVGCTALL